MKHLSLFLLTLAAPLLLISCTSSDPSIGNNAPGMGDDCSQICDRLFKQVQSYNEAMIINAGCQLGPYDGELGDGQATGTLDGETDYFCPHREATDALAEATASLSDDHRQAIKDWKGNCPCFVELIPCSLCEGVAPGGICPTEFLTGEECTAKGGIPSDR